MTMRELAVLANVSVSTVSKAFCDADDVSGETKEHIFEIAKQEGCFGKFYKGKFSKQVIAIICPEIKSGLYCGIVEKLRKVIEKNGGLVIIAQDDFSTSKQAELIEYFASYLKLDGIFVFGLNADLKKGYAIPIISLLHSKTNSTDSVCIDFDTPINEAVEYIYKSGHKKIAFVGERLTEGKAKRVLKAAQSFFLDCKIIESDLRFEKAGEKGAEEIHKMKDKPTAIFCAYDNIAFGLIKALKSKGYRIPEDFSVIGMDNTVTSEYIDSSLTSIDANSDEICMIAWDLMKKKLKNGYYRLKQNITVTGKLIKRETVKERLG